MTRNQGLVLLLAAIGAFIFQMIFKDSVYRWDIAPDAKRFVEHGYGQAVALAFGLVGAFFAFRQR